MPPRRGYMPFLKCLHRAGVPPLAELPLESMAVGDSVKVPPEFATAPSVYRTIGRAMKLDPTVQFVARSEQGGVRVWRTL